MGPMPASSSTRRHPCRTIGWSSMIRTEVMLFLLVRLGHRNRQPFPGRDQHAHAGAALWTRRDGKLSAQRTDALMHALQTETSRCIRRNTTSVIPDDKLDGRGSTCDRPVAIGRLAESNDDIPGLGVTDRVGQAFLDTAIDRQIDGVPVAARELCGGERKRNVGMLARPIAYDLGNEILQRNVAKRH